MQHMAIPRAISTLLILLAGLGWWFTSERPVAPTAVVAQPAPAIPTAKPTARPPVAKVARRLAMTQRSAPHAQPLTGAPNAAEMTAAGKLEQTVAELINQLRQAHDLPALTIATELTAAARNHSRDMANQPQPQHRGSDGSSAAERILAAGYPAIRTAEAIRWGDADPAEVVARWLDDDLHRNVIFSDQFSELGVGYVAQANGGLQHFWTADFGQRSMAGFQPVRYEPALFEPPATATPTPTFDRPEESTLLNPVSDGCPSVSERDYATIPMEGVDSSHTDWLHGDLNLAQRGYQAATAPARLIDLAGPTDPDAPQLIRLFADQRTPDFVATYQVNAWDWSCGGDGCRGDRLAEPEVTLLGLATTPGEPIYLPGRNAEIYSGGYVAAVLYADATRLTLAYTRDGTVAHGYAIQLENVCVDPNLLNSYRQANTAGRSHLPALQNGDLVGVAATMELLVATRDRGAFLEPRSRKDWWRG